jgi:hypothetical protein
MGQVRGVDGLRLIENQVTQEAGGRDTHAGPRDYIAVVDGWREQHGKMHVFETPEAAEVIRFLTSSKASHHSNDVGCGRS